MKNRLRKVQFKYLDYVFENMCSVKSKHYLDSTFFKKNDKVILELEKSGTLWVLYSVWSDISDTFSFEYEETQQLIKEWMEAQLKSREVTPGCFVARRNGQKKAQLKSREVEPIQNASFIRMEVEEQIEQGEVTPSVGILYVSDLMEEQLKSAEVTPIPEHFFYKPLMEEQIKSEEITPRNAIAPPFRWRKLDSEEVTPHARRKGIEFLVEEELESVEITPDIEWQRCGIWVEENLKSEEVKPTHIKGFQYFMNEEELESVEITPQRMNYVIIGGEGEEVDYNSDEITPKPSLTSYHLKVVEEQLKKEEITPKCNYFDYGKFVEEQLKSEEIIPHLGHTYEMGKIDEEYEKK